MRALYIFDFDGTVTKEHTFQPFRLEHHSLRDNIRVGHDAADRYQKLNIKQYLKHDSHQLSSVATYHNNPDFIAGMIGKILSKKLTLIRTDYFQNPTTTAVNYYEVEGTTPFLISYIPKCDNQDGNSFHTAMSALRSSGKNCQINILRDLLVKNDWISADSEAVFFDDTKDNFEAAKQLPQMSIHLVDPKNPQFSVMESFKSPALLAPSKHLGIESSAMFFSPEVSRLGGGDASCLAQLAGLNLESGLNSSASAGRQ